MSSTNKTSNYELSQFVGGDKPAWLADYNSDMSKIDAQMKLNADGVTTASGSATTANTAIGTLANLETTDKSSLVNAVNEVNTATGTAQSTANTANTTANSAKTEADGLQSYLTLTNTGTVSPTNITISAGSITNKNVRYASNADGTLGKLYGYIYGISIPGATTITISGLPFDVSEQFNVDGILFAQNLNDKTLYYPTITFNTNNTATINFSSNFAGANMNIYMGASVLFIKNFGD